MQRSLLAQGLALTLIAVPNWTAASPRPIATEQAAIKVAIKACDDSWGRFGRRQHTLKGHIPKTDWRAVLDSDHWTVWRGTQPMSAYQIDIPKDGTPVDGDLACVAQMGWDSSEGPNRMALGKSDAAGR